MGVSVLKLRNIPGTPGSKVVRPVFGLLRYMHPSLGEGEPVFFFDRACHRFGFLSALCGLSPIFFSFGHG
jgi:hypothetical protein